MRPTSTIPLWFRCLAAFAAAWLADVVAAVHIQTLVGGKMMLAASTILALQFINSYGFTLLADDRSWRSRLLVTASTASGAALGTVVVIACSH